MSAHSFKLRPQMANHSRVVVFAWYDSEQWDELKRVAADSGNLDESFADWCANALRAEREIQAAGHSVMRLLVNVAELEAWCRDQGVANTSSARAQYVAQLASRAAGGEG